MVRQDHGRIFCNGIGKWADTVLAGGGPGIIFFHNSYIAGNDAAFLVVNFWYPPKGSPTHRSWRMRVSKRRNLRIETMDDGMKRDRVIHIGINRRIVL